MKIADQLRAAKALIEDESHWTRGTLIRETLSGFRLYCALGAINAVQWADPDINGDLSNADEYLFEANANASVAKLNDEQGHAAVMALYDRAITLAEYVTI